MNKIVVGLIFGAVLGALDGATAWFTPDVRSMMTSIMVGSTFKGMMVGLLSGWFARKVNSTAVGDRGGLRVGAGVCLCGGGDAVGERAALLSGDHAAGLCGGRDHRVFNTKDGDVLPG